jgi:hypothetical protein
MGPDARPERRCAGAPSGKSGRVPPNSAPSFPQIRSARENNFIRAISRMTAIRTLRKIFLFLFFRNHVYLSASRLIEKGRTRRHDT